MIAEDNCRFVLPHIVIEEGDLVIVERTRIAAKLLLKSLHFQMTQNEY